MSLRPGLQGQAGALPWVLADRTQGFGLKLEHHVQKYGRRSCQLGGVDGRAARHSTHHLHRQRHVPQTDEGWDRDVICIEGRNDADDIHHRGHHRHARGFKDFWPD